ncbi:hypothetical protein [Celeribacter halophilus]|uniref:hypothetical protein n=1 Tax=Celeribacter halophilus TaxID=576117 RepID=UPI001C0959A4|nr:hypothetical protein [Celeribacter halophilus]MBU2889146.1 hypothetical protein [Celeribacter halophilus]MDO6510327.1 hypothetical protein [Celeribacter halophilus]
MSYSSEQWRAAISKLLKLTSLQKISWSPTDLFKGDAWTEVDRSFKADLNDKSFVVSATRTKYYFDEDEWVWNGGFDLSIFENIATGQENECSKIASSPDMSLISNLFTAAESNYAFARGALNDLLKK